MDRREFVQSSAALMLAGCGYTEVDDMPQEFTLQPSPKRSGHGINVTVPSYREALWTPTSSGTATYGVNTFGRYAKIGRLVFIEGALDITTIGTGNPLHILGMPFSALQFGTISIGVATNLATAVVSLVGRIYGSQIDLWSRTAASSDPALNAILGDTTYVEFSGWYHTADAA